MSRHYYVNAITFGIFMILLSIILSYDVCSASQNVTVLGDNTNYYSGVWTAYLAPFNKGNSTFNESLTLIPATFPNNCTFQWRWPPQPPNMVTITGYLAIDYGDYYGTNAQVTVPPSRVSSIGNLTLSHNVTMNNPADGNTVIYDLFLTATPQGDLIHLFEIELFMHSPPIAQSYFAMQTPIGNVTISGIHFMVALATGNHDILFMPINKADIEVATIDLKAIFTYLQSKNVINGSEWYNGHGFGVETANGAGSLLIHTMDVFYLPNATASSTSSISTSNTASPSYMSSSSSSSLSSSPFSTSSPSPSASSCLHSLLRNYIALLFSS